MKRRVKNKEALLKGYTKTSSDFWTKDGSPGISERMFQYCGKTLELELYTNSPEGWYYFDDWRWSLDMFEDKEDIIGRILKEVDELQ